ncbi:helix-turn-helix domain-containing protein [Saccharopolyspora sp. K220]|uniref:helix-turn-helix domain-containing protein n=1 Tax=Saccharopolyspora soli TaxID=2926618 RepID=UPI001F59482D|nr:helix-turn-helix domain-containing protein [Saccharopolyspora soli]MCI2420032.1 helix-turn-helix domain-containing protein [Saccharopolyspora soli]
MDALTKSLTALLDGLANDAAPTEYDGLLDDLLTALPGPSHPELAAAARGAHQAVAHRRQRERQLAVLYDTARDLVALRDVGATLGAVVERAHQVLPGADVTYLCLRDQETGGFYVLASVGLISPEFKHVKVPPGRGMSAEIERTRAALRVTRYLDDSAIMHDSGLDRALAKDGLASVLGAPLIARDEVLGVLFAANRHERAFTDEETALITALADFAALAIDNAHLFADATESRRTIEADNLALRRSAELHDRLARLVIRGAEVADVADALADVFTGQLLLLDRNDSLLAYRGLSASADAGGPEGVIAVDSDLLRDIGESRRTGRCVVRDDAEPPRLVSAVGTGRTFLGALVLARPAPVTSLDVRNLERAAQIVALLTLRQEAIVEAEERVRGELLGELLANHAPPTEATRLRACARHFDLARAQVTLAVRVASEEDVPKVRRKVLDLARTEEGIAGDFAGLLAVVLPAESAKDAAARLHQRIQRELGVAVVVCGVPPVDPRTGRLAGCFETARRGVALLEALGRTDAHASTEDLMLYGVLFDASRKEDLARFLDSTLGALRAHDRDQGSDLVGTLTVFFDSGGNAAEAARRMFVHPNTVTKRLDRVASLLGADWQTDHENLALRVALRLHQLSEHD